MGPVPTRTDCFTETSNYPVGITQYKYQTTQYEVTSHKTSPDILPAKSFKHVFSDLRGFRWFRTQVKSAPLDNIVPG